MLLYIHIPFCDSKCSYCAFNSYADKFHLKKDYMVSLSKALSRELEYVEEHNKKIETVFIGGGTPSAVDSAMYMEIFEQLNPYITDTTEITIEANPNSANMKWLSQMRSFGVNRVSFGVQSFNDDKLAFLGRSHNSKRAIKAIQEAGDAGFEDINCDIIYGVKGDTETSMYKDIDIIKKLPVNHVSAYDLTIEEGTKFYNKSGVKCESEELAKKLFKALEEAGFMQYEISNFAKNENARSRHNIGYWQHKEYLGVGSGAVGYKDLKRYYPKKEIEEYIKEPTLYEYEQLSEYDIKVEKILLGFRSVVGVDAAIFNQKEKQKIDELLSHNKLILKEGRVYNPNYLLADELALYIIEDVK